MKHYRSTGGSVERYWASEDDGATWYSRVKRRNRYGMGYSKWEPSTPPPPPGAHDVDHGEVGYGAQDVTGDPYLPTPRLPRKREPGPRTAREASWALELQHNPFRRAP